MYVSRVKQKGMSEYTYPDQTAYDTALDKWGSCIFFFISTYGEGTQKCLDEVLLMSTHKKK